MWDGISSIHFSIIFAVFGVFFVLGLGVTIFLAICGSGLNRKQLKEERRKSWHYLCESLTVPTVRLLMNPTDTTAAAAAAADCDVEQAETLLHAPANSNNHGGKRLLNGGSQCMTPESKQRLSTPNGDIFV